MRKDLTDDFSPVGAASCVGAIINGRVVDKNYARNARKLGFAVDRKKGDDLRNFPIERTRLQTVFPGMILGVAAFIPYGWVLEQHVHLAAPLVLQFIISFSFIASLNTLNTLIIDLFPERPATAAAACNLVRCWLGAVGAAIIDYMLDGMGWGWCFAFQGLLMGAGLFLLLVERAYGMGWREKRLAKLDAKRAQKEQEQEEQKQGNMEEEEKDGKTEEGEGEGTSGSGSGTPKTSKESSDA